MSPKEEGSTIEFEGHKYTVSRVNGEIKLTPITQTEVLADPSLAAAVSKAMVDNVEVNMLVVARR